MIDLLIVISIFELARLENGADPSLNLLPGRQYVGTHFSVPQETIIGLGRWLSFTFRGESATLRTKVPNHLQFREIIPICDGYLNLVHVDSEVRTRSDDAEAASDPSAQRATRMA